MSFTSRGYFLRPFNLSIWNLFWHKFLGIQFHATNKGGGPHIWNPFWHKFLKIQFHANNHEAMAMDLKYLSSKLGCLYFVIQWILIIIIFFLSCNNIAGQSQLFKDFSLIFCYTIFSISFINQSRYCSCILFVYLNLSHS